MNENLLTYICKKGRFLFICGDVFFILPLLSSYSSLAYVFTLHRAQRQFRSGQDKLENSR